MSNWFDRAIAEFCSWFEPLSFFGNDSNVRGLIAIVFVSLICGAVGSLVVGNRMAFFSDALAHCAFAGVSLGILVALLTGVRDRNEFQQWTTPIMVGFGIAVGLLIAFVREKSRLASDTVIGVFFAGAVGLGAVLIKFARRSYFNPENFLFGDFLTVRNQDLVFLLVLVVVTWGTLWWIYDDFVLASFNPSLALSRRVRVRLCNYVFIVLLATIVNVCLQTVGVLLINAMLLVPAATAALLCRNLRQVFWTTIFLCFLVGVGGVALSWNITVLHDRLNPDHPIQLGSGGVMVVLSVVLFVLAMLVAPILRGRDR